MLASSSSSSSSPAPTLPSLSHLRRRSVVSIFVSSKKPLHGGHRLASSGLRLFASIAERQSLELSWSSPEDNSGDDYCGWAVSDPPARNHNEKRGLAVFVVGGVGASLAVIVAAIAYLSLSTKGFKFRISSPVDGVIDTVESEASPSTITDNGESDGATILSELNSESEPNAVRENVTSTFTEKVERVIVPVAVDSTQRKALTVSKKLKILEDEVKANELCTRREYARWLIRMNSLLERDPRRRIIPSVSLLGSTTPAFDDVSVEDVDFGSIQALAEAGVISSKLSNSGYNGLNGNGDVCFYPDRFVSRQALIEWKGQLEYQIALGTGTAEQVITSEVGFMDMKEMKSDASPGLYKDMLAGHKSILRKVFGQSKRFQPNKPTTKAQAAVALTSGRMAEAIRNELLKLEAENSARQVEMEAILSELLERGDIRKFWDEKLNEEKARGFEVEKSYHTVVAGLEDEKVAQEKHYADNLKEKAAMDCQRQLLLTLKEEVDEMSEKLASERTSYVAEQCNLRTMLSDLESKQEEMLDAKSILEAEIEALRILRSWVEDEARKSQARAKVLEEVGRRWKWDDQS